MTQIFVIDGTKVIVERPDNLTDDEKTKRYKAIENALIQVAKELKK